MNASLQPSPVTTPAPLAAIIPAQKAEFVEGAILKSSWGHEQTNVDYFCIIKRSGDYVTLAPMVAVITEQGDMRGKCRPGVIDANEPTFRRKVYRNTGTGEEYGVKIKSYSCAWLWEGREDSFTSYA